MLLARDAQCVWGYRCAGGSYHREGWTHTKAAASQGMRQTSWTERTYSKPITQTL